MTTFFTASPGVDVIATTADIPSLGSLAINAFVLHGREPDLQYRLCDLLKAGKIKKQGQGFAIDK